jgi:hypothetical protein
VVRTQVDTCAAFVVVMTPSAEETEWVGREIDQAQQEGRQIRPLLLAGTRFFRLAELQYEDVRDNSMPSGRFIDQLTKRVDGSANLGWVGEVCRGTRWASSPCTRNLLP